MVCPAGHTMEKANDTEYALASYIATHDIKTAIKADLADSAEPPPRGRGGIER